MCFGTPDTTCPTGFTYGEFVYLVASQQAESGFNGTTPRTVIFLNSTHSYLTMSFCCGTSLSVEPSEDLQSIASNSFDKSGTNEEKSIIAAASAVGGLLLIFVIVLGVFLFKKRKQKQQESASVELDKQTQYSAVPEGRISISPFTGKRSMISTYETETKSNWLIHFDEIELEKELGSGSFGKVT